MKNHGPNRYYEDPGMSGAYGGEGLGNAIPELPGLTPQLTAALIGYLQTGTVDRATIQVDPFNARSMVQIGTNVTAQQEYQFWQGARRDFINDLSDGKMENDEVAVVRSIGIEFLPLTFDAAGVITHTTSLAPYLDNVVQRSRLASTGLIILRQRGQEVGRGQLWDFPSGRGLGVEGLSISAAGTTDSFQAAAETTIGKIGPMFSIPLPRPKIITSQMPLNAVVKWPAALPAALTVGHSFRIMYTGVKLRAGSFV